MFSRNLHLIDNLLLPGIAIAKALHDNKKMFMQADTEHAHVWTVFEVQQTPLAMEGQATLNLVHLECCKKLREQAAVHHYGFEDYAKFDEDVSRLVALERKHRRKALHKTSTLEMLME